LLVAFLRDRDAPCPRCGYNPRGLLRDVCPECREPLQLTVGLKEARIGWLTASLVPGAFSGLAAGFLLYLLVTIVLSPTGFVPWPIFVIDAFGFLSGAFTIGLYMNRAPFLRFPRSRQAGWTLAIWAIHIGMFIAFVAVMSLL
jgi:hypothetical protein